MPDRFSASLRAFVPVPPEFPELATALEEIFEKIGLTQIDLLVTPPAIPDDPLDLLPPLTEEEAFAELAFFDDGTEIPPPPIPPIPQEIREAVKLDMGKRTLTLKLKALSDIVVNLPGFKGASLIINPGGFEAVVTLNDDGVSLAFTVGLAARFSSELVQPMRKITEANGTVRYEKDESRAFVQVTLGDVAVSVDTAGKLNFESELRARLIDPVMIGETGVILDAAEVVFELGGEQKCLAFKWSEPNLNRLLKQVAADFLDQSAPVESELVLRVLFGADDEIRLDWQIAGEGRAFALPGLKITTPNNARVSLIFGPGAESLRTLSFVLTLAPGSELIAESNFAWERDEDRELQNDDEREPEQPPLLKITATVKTVAEGGPAEGLSLVLMQLKTDEAKLPKFFRQLEAPLPALDFNDLTTLCNPSPFELTSLKSSAWKIDLDVNAEEGLPFTLPFLKQKDGGDTSQFITLHKKLSEIGVDFEQTFISCPLGITVNFGSLHLQTEVLIKFNWETFGLKIDHDKGLELISEKAQLPENATEHLGLAWRFKGREITEAGPNQGKFHYLTLATKNYNYQIQQAPGAVIELEFGKITKEPILFSVRDFVLSPKGVSLIANVTNRPASLNGIDTKFTFEGEFDIKENRINEFTLAGEGPLPPALVGEATARIALQFGQRDGNLTLIAGGAELKGTKLLEAKNTRFQFQIDAIGLKFVYAGKFHLYFTLTGSAKFVLASGDDVQGPLALLPNITIALVECPLTGDASVLAKHVKFLIELPKKVSFSFLGCFEMELRAIGFIPQAEVFKGDAAMELSGQIKFAQGAGDQISARIDFHNLFIGVPKRGSFVPRLYFKQLEVNLSVGAAFKLNGTVEYIDELTEKGFFGSALIQLQGLPAIAASMAFLRVRESESSPWLRAWFIYLEVRQVSFQIYPGLIYLREVGLGFGYRYTIASIKAADVANDTKTLLRELDKLSRTQGELSKRDRWAIDIESARQDPRWTIVLRAMISQSTASPSALKWMPAAEKELACLFLFDAVIAFRSDLTFFMAARGWFFVNYHDFVIDNDGVRNRPLITGYILLSPRKKRFLARVVSNPNGRLGLHPRLPEFVQGAVSRSQFSATLLVEPGLFHLELGWPNMLRWREKIGPLTAEFRGGFIFRVSKRELVQGISYLARARMEIDAGFDFSIVGVRLIAKANVAFGARYILVLNFSNLARGSALYGAIGLEVLIHFTILFWIKIKLIFKTIKLKFKFSFTIGFTAGLEVGLLGVSSFGVRGTGTVFLKVMGRKLHLSIKIGVNESAVAGAFNRTQKYLNIGLEATEVEGVPGVGRQTPRPALQARGVQALAVQREARLARTMAMRATAFAAVTASPGFNMPGYNIFVVRNRSQEAWSYFALLPQGEREDGAQEPGFLPVPPREEFRFTLSPLLGADLNTGVFTEALRNAFAAHNITLSADVTLQVLVASALWRVTDQTQKRAFEIHKDRVDDADTFNVFETVLIEHDFILSVPGAGVRNDFELQHFEPFAEDWIAQPLPAGAHLDIGWRVNWKADFAVAQGLKSDGNGTTAALPEESFDLAKYLRNAFKQEIDDSDPDNPIATPIGDPDLLPPEDEVIDERVQNPTDAAFEAAVRGAIEQFNGSPFFKKDPNLEYERVLDEAFKNTTTIYNAYGQLPEDNEALQETQTEQQAQELRGMVLHDLIADTREYAEAEDAAKPEVRASIPFQMGLVFRYRGADVPSWLQTSGDEVEAPTIRQRLGIDSTAPANEAMPVRVFNVADADFSSNPPQFQKVRHYADANTIAITWELAWERPPLTAGTASQADPEHHLMHYHVRRRNLEGNEREAVFTVKSAEALHRETHFEITESVLQTLGGLGVPVEKLRPLLAEGNFSGYEKFIEAVRKLLSAAEFTQHRANILQAAFAAEQSVLKRLRPRFQVADHFTQESVEDIAALPATGRSYLYTITPVDFAGHAARPLTLVATRYPNEPPQVPANAELIVTYLLEENILSPANATPPGSPRVFVPQQVHVAWQDPAPLRNGPNVAIADYVLVFRKRATLPIGSFGLDSTVNEPEVKAAPVSNARPLPTDIKITLAVAGQPSARTAEIAIAALQAKGILPPGDAAWIPESWQVFFQTISANGVPSALAPVQLLLRAQTGSEERREERRPAELEWLAHPIHFPLLPPEDLSATAGTAYFPMPVLLLEITEAALQNLQARVPAAVFAALTDMRQENLARGSLFSQEEFFVELETRAGAALRDEFEETILQNVQEHTPRFTGALHEIGFATHPAGIRAIRFRWNQGPSRAADYPLDLNAGYHLLELDSDAHTDDTFNERGKLAQALREIQEAQMLPASDLLHVPADTLAVNQWEAWYPGAILRRRAIEKRPPGSEIPLRPWYSWRESILEWPAWENLTDPANGLRASERHPFLQALVDTLNENPEEKKRSNGQLLPTYDLDIQITPPLQPGTLAELMQSTAQAADPYGWGVLQRLGLSVALTLREENTGAIISGEDMLRAVHEVLEAHRNDAAWKAFYDFLHVELLIQPGRSTRLQPGQLEAGDLLALVQLSLRPRLKQTLKYGSLVIFGPGSARLNAVVKVQAGKQCMLINQTDTAAGHLQLQAAPGEALVAKTAVRLAFDGYTSLLLRGEELPVIGFALNKPPVDVAALQEFFNFIAAPEPHLVPKISLLSLSAQQRETIRAALAPEDQSLADFRFSLVLPFPVTDEFSSVFTPPVTLAVKFADANAEAGRQWRRFQNYVESLNSTAPDTSEETKIKVPVAANEIETLLPDFLAWSQRFFEANGEVQSDPVTKIGAAQAGPWLVTAYPRAGSPASVAPDASSRLTYFHLLEDRWAHNYRYYIRPYGRYDLLWQSFRQSPLLFPNGALEKLEEAVPDPEAGGLDVVLERTHPVSMPLVLGSRRLDEASTPAKPPSPGATWEVIVAQHPEQALIERNQTLVRQLAYRQIAFTLLRRFALPQWIPQLESAVAQYIVTAQVLTELETQVTAAVWHALHSMKDEIVRGREAFKTRLAQILGAKYNEEVAELIATYAGHRLEINFIENRFPEIPDAYPAQPDHIRFTPGVALDETTSRSLDLPERMPAFQQSALVLQWEALPFYYEHRLALIAQTASNVSAINEVFQRDFEYRSPLPAANAEGLLVTWTPQAPFANGAAEAIPLRTRQMEIPLARFWDCLPEKAQQQWRSEEPDPKAAPEPKRKLAGLPDPEVVYQIVEFFSGNLEVQAEFYFDQNLGRYALRQLGKRFLAELKSLDPPAASLPQADYALLFTLQQISEAGLGRAYDKQNIALPTRHKIAFKDKLLSVVSVFTRADRNHMLLDSIDELKELRQRLNLGRAQAEEFLQTWYAARAVSSPPDLSAVPAALAAKLDDPEPMIFTLAWSGAMNPQQRTALLTLAALHAADVEFADALRGLADANPNADQTVFQFATAAPIGRNLPHELRSQLRFEAHGLNWRGVLSPGQNSALLQYRTDSTVYQNAAPRLLAAIRTHAFEAPYPVPPRPRPDSALPGTLGIIIHHLVDWELRWTGEMTSAEATALRGLSGDADFHNGIDSLIVQVRGHLFMHQIAPGTGHPTTNLPGTFEIEVTTTGRTLKWTGPMTVAEENALNNLARNPAFDGAFRNGVPVLINQVRAFYPGKVFTAIISFAWPRVKKAEVEAAIKHALPGLELPPEDRVGPLRWIGAHNLALRVEHIISRGQSCLQSGDPFIAAFAQLLEQIPLQDFFANFWTPRRPLPNGLPSLLQTQLLVGCRLLRCKSLLTEAELQTLTGLFEAEPDKASLRRLHADLQDQQVLEELYQDWYSTVAVSQALSELPPELAGLIDFPEAANCALAWEGRMSAEESAALSALPGDEAFTSALQRLISAAIEAEEETLSQESALRGLDQVPETLREPLQFSTDAAGANYTELRWQGLLFAQQEEALQQWSQPLPAFAAAAATLAANLESATFTETLTPPRPLPEELPASLQNRLQIDDEELAWLNPGPTAEQLEALNALAGDEDFIAARDNLLSAITADAGQSCVVKVPMAFVPRRPRPADVPEALQAQLTITNTEMVWRGRISHARTLHALENLPGDAPFAQALQNIVAALQNQQITVAFTLPVRPQAQALPEILRSKLLLGKALARFHGLMTRHEGQLLQAQFELLPDQRAVQRLYSAAVNKGLRGRELRVRARRGSATPSAMQPLTGRMI